MEYKEVVNVNEPVHHSLDPTRETEAGMVLDVREDTMIGIGNPRPLNAGKYVVLGGSASPGATVAMLNFYLVQDEGSMAVNRVFGVPVGTKLGSACRFVICQAKRIGLK